MKRFKSTIIATLAVFVAVACMLPSAPASAVSSAALSIVPKKNYTIEPGKSIGDKLTIRNLDSNESLSLTMRVVDFTFTDDGGTPKLMLAEDAPQTTWSLKPFLSLPKTVTIPAKTSKSVDMKVTIPAGHGAGSYYSAIVYSSGSSDGGNVGLSASGVTLVFASIPGEVKESLKLEQFGAYHMPKAGKEGAFTFITANKPEAIAYKLKNDGNVTEAPVGSITLKHMFGKEQSIDNINPNSSLALIGQSRTFTACIKLKSEEVNFNGERSRSTACTTPDLWPGYYSIGINGYYGQNGNRTQEIVQNGGFWYLPWWFVLVSLIVIVIAAYYGAKAYRTVQYKLYGTKPNRKSRRR